MALPYPNMDFTSLDILTAADMDKLVANIEYLGQQTTVEQVPTSTFCTATTGFTISQYGAVYKMGKIVFGNLTIKKDSGTYSSSQDTVFTIASAYRPKVAVNSFVCLSSSEWTTMGVCYGYMLNSLIVKDSNNLGYNWAKVQFLYVIN